jgi:hypothetical protein
MTDQQRETAVAAVLALVPDGSAFWTSVELPEAFKGLVEKLGPGSGNPKRRMDGGFQRNYMNGIVIFNPAINNNIVVLLDGDHTDALSGTTAKKFYVASPGGKILLVDSGTPP